MKKVTLVAVGALLLAGCQTLGTVTPMEKGYIAEATVNNGDMKEAKSIALKTAEDQCSKKGQEFYVIDSATEAKNEFEMDDNTSNVANFASKLLLGQEAFEQERTVKLHFDCR
ncbi:hypothetical protein [Marinomonas fungiae]|uniref:hypothetical protein n=1 Tax=Marinomonas fungiae TaxID=1137284 RepID=UPI003A8D9673